MTESNQMTAVFSAVAQVPNILTNINTGIQAGKCIAQVPAAAVGAAPTPATWPIVGLGVEMVIFLLKTAEAIKQDIEGVKKSMENTEQTESETLREAQAAADAFSTMNCSSTGTFLPDSTGSYYNFHNNGPRTATAVK